MTKCTLSASTIVVQLEFGTRCDGSIPIRQRVSSTGIGDLTTNQILLK